MLMLGSRKVALFSGRFCLLFSDTGGAEVAVSGSDIDLAGIGEPVGVDDPDEVGETATNRLNPKPSRPEIAVKVPPTPVVIEGGEVVLGPALLDGPAAALLMSPAGSKRLLAPSPTTLTELATMSRSLFPRVGFGGGGGGFRMPFNGALGRRRAGESLDGSTEGVGRLDGGA